MSGTASQAERRKLNRSQKFLSVKPNAKLVQMTLRAVGDRSDHVRTLLHGPLHDVGDADLKAARIKLMGEFTDYFNDGNPHRFWMKCQHEAAARDPALAHDPLSINVVIPALVLQESGAPMLKDCVVLSDVRDCERIARRHVKKDPRAKQVLFGSVISTTDNAHWARQRKYLTPTFLPRASLAEIFPTSLARAQHCAARLGPLASAAGPHGVQMHEFYLHEAQAQLQMALFGMDEKFMESTNERIRGMFSGIEKDPNYAVDVCLEMMGMVKSNPDFAASTETAVREGKKRVFGPLSKTIDDAMTELDMSLADRFGNMLIVLFAGHDTTAHTMTWLTYELARHPHYQRRVQAEVDAMFASLGGRDMTYDDCGKMPFLTRCITETLRLWTVVPNGTFRELVHDDEVVGPGGKPVVLPKGTYVQVNNWTRHRNPVLWGADVNEFNPDREFRGNEIWGLHGSSFHASNPSSPRFSPFTYAPRDCLGKNFAQMEMRVILANVLRRWSFELSEPYSDASVAANGPLENVAATMGPRDLTPGGLAEQRRRKKRGVAPTQTMAMFLRPVPRPGARL